MTETSAIEKLYDSLKESIDTLIPMRESLKKENSVLKSWVNFVMQNDSEIVGFEKVTIDFKAWMDAYDFSKGMHFDEMQRMLQGLHPLRLRIVKMGEAAKNLAAFPDRYNVRKSIETCRNLVLACREKMCLVECGKVIQLVEANTQRLMEIKILFDRDEDTLQQIKSIINSDRKVLEQFKAYYAELLRFVSDFPHEGQNDLDKVIKRISIAKGLLKKYKKVDKDVQGIKDYCNRYGKDLVISNYQTTIQTMFSSMQYQDVGIIETRLDDVQKQVNAVRSHFSQELINLDVLKASLTSRRPDIWREDNERLLTMVLGLLRRDVRKIDFDINDLKNSYLIAKENRRNAINYTKAKYPWLESIDKYRNKHERIISKYIESSEYHSTIKKMCREVFWRSILWLFVPIIGWIILLKRKGIIVWAK